ncbi:MAG: UvrD-helicase domain-containing protein [Clostridia bacterium]|nr:UvrD-helicase domain-containing protein [Clostridia bacterium]
MAAYDHPAYAEENRHLTETIGVIKGEQALAQDELYQSERELKHARAFDPDKLPIREMLYFRAVQNVKNLSLSEKKPYFTRIQFREDGKREETYYIGKYGVTESRSLSSVVIDWRAPLANLYYSGQLGRVDYTAPDGRVEGEMTLKRQLEITDGELTSIFDTDIVSQDAYLQNALNAMSGNRLKEIVTTIQAEQNFVIRHPLKTSLIVQGVAGSGKTTIALHRIAYLLYAFQNQLKSENMLILAPNPLFLNYIAGVLPDLGVDRVMQTTFTQLLRDYLTFPIGKIDTSDRTERVLSESASERNRITKIARTKGSIKLLQLIDRFLDTYERDFAPEDGLSFGPAEVYSKEEMDKFLLVDEKPFPMARRVEEFKKQLQKRTNDAARRINTFLLKESDRRAAAIRAQEKDPDVLKERLNRLYESRDRSMKQTTEQIKPFVKQAISSLPTLNVKELYPLFWKFALKNTLDCDIKMTADHTLSLIFSGKPLENEDLAPLAYIAMRVQELKKFEIRHIVIDEAQDFSPFEFCLLRKMMPAATFTVVGDLMQGIHGWRGLSDWDEIVKTETGLKNAATHQLVTSYRNTVEVMETALRIAKKRPTKGQTDVKPVVRHGAQTEFIRLDKKDNGAKRIFEAVSDYLKLGMHSICVISRTESEAKHLSEKLSVYLTAVKLLSVNDQEYGAGVYVAPACSVKGLEFDGVIIEDASDEKYPDDDLNARLLYVCLTRPLHRLMVFFKSRLTPLLED